MLGRDALAEARVRLRPDRDVGEEVVLELVWHDLLAVLVDRFGRVLEVGERRIPALRGPLAHAGEDDAVLMNLLVDRRCAVVDLRIRPRRERRQERAVLEGGNDHRLAHAEQVAGHPSPAALRPRPVADALAALEGEALHAVRARNAASRLELPGQTGLLER